MLCLMQRAAQNRRMLPAQFRPLSGRQIWLWNLLIAASYFTLGTLGRALTLPETVVAALWPPAGISLIALFLFGWRALPGVGVGAFVTGFVTLTPEQFRQTGPLLICVSSAIGASTAAALGGYWLRWAVRKQLVRRETAKTLLLFVVGTVSCLITATNGAISLCEFGTAPWSEFRSIWFTWWLGDTMGVFVTAPVLLAFAAPEPEGIPARPKEGVAAISLAALLAAWIFLEAIPGTVFGSPQEVALLPLLIWATLRLSLRCTSLLILVISSFIVWGMAHGHGPHTSSDSYHNLNVLSNYLCFGIPTILLAAVANRERMRFEFQLSAANRNLEQLVEKRTVSLADANRQLTEEMARQTDMGSTLSRLDHYLEGKSPHYSVEFRLRHKNGSYRWIHARGELFKAPDGKPIRLLGCHLDITERKRTEQRLHAFALLGQQLSAVNAVSEAARLIAALAETLLGWDAAIVMMFDEQTGRCRSVLGIDLIDGVKKDIPSEREDKEPTPGMRRVITHGAQLILRTGTTAPTDDLQTFGDTTRRSASLMFVPIRDGMRTFGILSIQRYHLNAYTPADLETLQALADHGGGALTRLRSREIQMESERRLAAAQLQAHLGSWEYHFRSRKMIWSQGLHTLVGQSPNSRPLRFAELKARIPLEDQPLLETLREKLPHLKEPHSLLIRFQDAHANLRHFSLRTECTRDAQGRPLTATGIVQDVTEQQQAERALRESSHRLELALEVASMGTWEINLSNRTVHAGRRLKEMFTGPGGTPADEPFPFQKYIHPEDLPQLRNAARHALNGTEQLQEKFRVIWPDQTTRWIETQGRVVRDGESQTRRLVGVAVDVTERHQAQEALRRTEQQYAELVNNLDGIVWEADIATLRMTFVSHQAQRLLGYPVSRWLEQEDFWQTHIHPDDRDFALSYCAARTQRGEDHNFEYRMVAADGRPVWVADFVTVVKENHRPTALRGVMVDITRLKLLEHEQARALSLLRATIDSSEEGLLVVDRDNHARIYNQRFVEMWKIPANILAAEADEAMLRFVLNQLTQPEDFLARVQHLYSHPEQESFDIITFKDGRTFERSSRPHRLQSEIVGRVWSFRDVTERRSNEGLIRGQAQILEGIASGATLTETLTELCLIAEAIAPEMRASVLIMSEDRKHLLTGAAPSLPAEYSRFVNGLTIGPKVGSCGTAAFRESSVIVEDIETDPLWEDFRAEACRYQLRACWSTPIFNAARHVMGTLAFYYPTPRRPTERERRIIETATHTAAIAILKHNTDEQLSRSAKILRQLSGNLLAAHEAERRHLARELHDEFGQMLTATKIMLETIAHEDSGAPTPASHSLRNAIRHVETLLQQVRTLSLSLRPTILDDCGLPAALRWLLDQHTQSTGRPVRLEIKNYDGDPKPEVQTASFRIAQEALTNISRHSQATKVNVVLQCDPNNLTLTITDDGIGFDVVAATRRAQAGESIGLLGQQERASLLGGKVEIRSTPGHGTEIQAEFPINNTLAT